MSCIQRYGFTPANTLKAAFLAGIGFLTFGFRYDQYQAIVMHTHDPKK
jgi:hypothetical protein